MNSILQNSFLGPLFIVLLAWLPTIVFLSVRATIQEGGTKNADDFKVGQKPYLFYIRFLCALAAFGISLLLFQKWSIHADEMNKSILFLNSLVQGACSWYFIKWVEPQFAHCIDFNKITGLPVLGDFSVTSDASKLDQLRERFLTCLNQDSGKIIIGVSEPTEGCGKSLLAAALAKSFSRTNKNVLLIEADLWKHTPHGYIPHSERNRIPGFSEYMQGQVSFEDALYYPSDESFVIMPRGQLKEKASKILSAEFGDNLLTECLAKFDRVIIDCPNYEKNKDINKLISNNGCLVLSISNQMRSKRIFNLMQGLKKGGLLARTTFVFTHML